MKIVLCSHAFSPSVGGVEEVSFLLALEFSRLGHRVRVITQTIADDGQKYPFEVLRRPSIMATIRSVQWCDIFFQNNVSLRTLWPLILFDRPWFVAHHTWIARPDGRITWRDYLKRMILGWAINIGGGPAMGRASGSASIVIDNPFPDQVYKLDLNARRTRDIIFVGRLVSDKGADILLDALFHLKNLGLKPKLTVVGSGPEEVNLRRQCIDLNLESQVKFVGSKKALELAALLNQHGILVVPSRWKEPFGLVAIEGIACGCLVLGSADGGLKEAIGPCGMTFPNGNVLALAEKLVVGLSSLDTLIPDRSEAEFHLKKHRPSEVARAYLKVFSAKQEQYERVH